MKTIPALKRIAVVAFAALMVLAARPPAFSATPPEHTSGTAAGIATGVGVGEATGANTTGTRRSSVVVKHFEPVPGTPRSLGKELPWLGVSAEEASEVVASQLALDSGVGLVVTYVAPESPAAQTGLEKNDVLIEFEGQPLVHPAQLRKLVQSRKEGDRVALAFYRAGKKQTASATLAKTTPGLGLPDGEHAWQGDLRELQRQLRELPIGDAVREQMKTLRESLGNVQFDQKKVQEDIRRSVEEARKAWQDAMQHLTNANGWLAPAREAIKELEKSGVRLDNKTTVTVRNTGKTVKSIVKTDESGTLTLLSTPKLLLTAHDKDGKLLFDGAIETPEQRAQVPPEVWERVEPLLEKLKPAAGAEPPEELENEEVEMNDASAGNAVPPTVHGQRSRSPDRAAAS